MVPVWMTFSKTYNPDFKVTIIQRQITQKWYKIELYLQWPTNTKSYIDRRHFQWPWTTFTLGFKVTPFVDAEYLRNGTRYRYLCNSWVSCSYLHVAANPLIVAWVTMSPGWKPIPWIRPIHSWTGRIQLRSVHAHTRTKLTIWRVSKFPDVSVLLLQHTVPPLSRLQRTFNGSKFGKKKFNIRTFVINPWRVLHASSWLWELVLVLCCI